MAANSRDEDRALAKTARAAIARTALDITQLNIACRGGIIEMDGKVRAPRGGGGQRQRAQRVSNHQNSNSRRARRARSLRRPRRSSRLILDFRCRVSASENPKL